MKYLFPTIVGFFFLSSCQQNQAQNLNPASICYELITVDFEPEPFGNLVQTVPYHIPKQPMNDAFVSVKIATHQMPWIVWFSSEFVTFKQDAPTVIFDEYLGDLDFQVSQSGNLSILETQIWDTLQMRQLLNTYQQIIADLEIECFDD